MAKTKTKDSDDLAQELIDRPDSESPLQEMVNEPRPVKAFDREYEIKKFGLGQAARALQYVGPFGFLLRNLQDLPRDKKGKVLISPDQALEFAITAISISGESVLGLISVATQEPIEFLEDKDPLDGLEIFVAVLEKNADFFSQKNLERAKALFGRLQGAIPMLGGGTSTN